MNEQVTSATKTLNQALDKHRKHVSDSLDSGIVHSCILTEPGMCLDLLCMFKGLSHLRLRCNLAKAMPSTGSDDRAPSAC
jgi:hypothetical protein